LGEKVEVGRWYKKRDKRKGDRARNVEWEINVCGEMIACQLG
jgi:hypothetical protein